MSSNEPRKRRLAGSLLALSATAALAASLAAPASAAKGQGEAVVVPANHSKGRTLSGQGVKLLPGAGAGGQDGKLTLPIGELDLGAPASATTAAGLNFKRGKRTVALTGIRFDLSAGTLTGKLGDETLPVFWLGGAPKVDGSGGSVALSEGKLRLTMAAAKVLRQKLGLERALVGKGVGMIWLAAQAFPTHGPAQKVVSGSLQWGFLTSWREYIYKNLGPGSIGSITTEGGATTVGEPFKPGSYFSFPAAAGSFEPGLYGASDKLSLSAQGSVKFAKPGHCIVEIKFSDIVVTLGPSSSIVASLVYDIDKFNKTEMKCEDGGAPVVVPSAEIATLGSLAPTYSGDGKTITWSSLPATLTAAAATPFEPQYKAGQVLDPATISVGIG